MVGSGGWERDGWGEGEEGGGEDGGWGEDGWGGGDGWWWEDGWCVAERLLPEQRRAHPLVQREHLPCGEGAQEDATPV